jgi:di/tricarboxylate transporter
VYFLIIFVSIRMNPAIHIPLSSGAGMPISVEISRYREFGNADGLDGVVYPGGSGELFLRAGLQSILSGRYYDRWAYPVAGQRLTLLLVSGILTPQEALSGLANEGMVTVAVLYVVVAGVRDTGGLEWVVQRLLGQPRSESHAQMRLMTQAAGLSAFLNNTPVVALLVPAVQDWARRHRLSVSRLMIPLSYASIAGGTCTLIGTSTNLVLNGLLVSETDHASLGLFELAWIGVPLVLLVILYITMTSRWLLPKRVPAVTRYDSCRGYT